MAEATGFLGYYEQKLTRPQTLGLRVTAQGLFIEDKLIPELFEEYRLWIQRESNSGRLLEVEQVEEKLLGSNKYKEFYLPEGKVVLVGKLLPLESLGQAIKLTKYEGTVIDTATLLHPKDPLFTTGSLRTTQTQHGIEITATVLGKPCSFSNAVLKDFFELVKKLPRIKRRYPQAFNSLRGAVSVLALLLGKARPVQKENILFMPSHLRVIPLRRLVASSGIYFVLSTDGASIQECFSPLGHAILGLIRHEIDELRKTAKRGRVGGVEFSKKIPQIVGFINVQQDRFTLGYRLLDEFFKLRGFKSEQDPKDKHVYTCFDLVLRLSREFEQSVWVLPQDLKPSERGKSKDQLLYRASKGYLFHITKQRQIVNVMRRGKKPDSNLKLILKPLEVRLQELKASASTEVPS